MKSHPLWEGLGSQCRSALANCANEGKSFQSRGFSFHLNKMAMAVAPDGFQVPVSPLILLLYQGQCRGWLLRSAGLGCGPD